MFKENKTLVIVALIGVVNALGYGIIIPILYTYSLKYGLSVFQNGLLFTIFSICSFFSAPFIGRLSDKYGRRPTLTVSIAGTALSFFTMAFAPSAIFLFIARAIDGITAGNMPVVSAVISDTTKPEDRAKGFGIIGASFGFGFVFGPAISALTYGINPALPFIISGVIAMIATIITWVFLPETNKHIGQVEHKRLFDFSGLYHALFMPALGRVLIIGLVYAAAFSVYITVFQPYAVNVMHYNATAISVFFTTIGVIGILTQVFLVGRLVKWLGAKKLFSLTFLATAIVFVGMFFVRSLIPFIIFGMLFAFVNSFVMALTSTIISTEADAKSQGSVQGISASYQGVGQIIGPIIGGAVASVSLPLPFLVIALMAAVCFGISIRLVRPKHVIHAFEK